MALEGTLKDFPLPDIIQLIGLSRKTGAVEIVSSDGAGTGKLYFAQGKVISAALDDLAPLEAAFALFTFPSGSFRFNESEPAPDGSAPITLSNEFLIIQGIERADAWAQVRSRVPSLDLVLGLIADPAAGNRDINLTPEQWRVLTMVNGRDSVRQIAQRTGFSDFATAQIVAHLLGAGLIGRQPVARPARPAPAPALSTRLDAMPRVPLPSPAATPSDALPPAQAPPGTAAAARVAGAALYTRLEALVAAELGHTGRTLLSDAYKRLRLPPGANLPAATAGSLCDQFERGATMLLGSGRARTLADTLRRAVADSFAG